jgi:hypothetical protein
MQLIIMIAVSTKLQINNETAAFSFTESFICFIRDSYFNIYVLENVVSISNKVFIYSSKM